MLINDVVSFEQLGPERVFMKHYAPNIYACL